MDLDMTPRYAPTIDLFPTATGFRMIPVEQYIAHPPGQHPAGCPLVKDCTALELRAGNSSRWYGCTQAYINAELRMVVIGTNPRDEVRMKWPIEGSVSPRPDRPAKREPFNTYGCTIERESLAGPILVACNNNVNRYLKTVWRVTFPDGTWCRVGTKQEASRYAGANIHNHSV